MPFVCSGIRTQADILMFCPNKPRRTVSHGS
nr:MAG TPA: hypothetical protein [Caudoviricetes sp.]